MSTTQISAAVVGVIVVLSGFGLAVAEKRATMRGREGSSASWILSGLCVGLGCLAVMAATWPR